MSDWRWGHVMVGMVGLICFGCAVGLTANTTPTAGALALALIGTLLVVAASN